MDGKPWSRSILAIWVISICIISYYSLIPDVELPGDFWNADKIYHFIAYGWLALLPAIGFTTPGGGTTGSLAMVILGILLEIGQEYVPGRTFSFGDMAANTLGVMVGMACGRSLRSRLRNRSNSNNE